MLSPHLLVEEPRCLEDRPHERNDDGTVQELPHVRHSQASSSSLAAVRTASDSISVMHRKCPLGHSLSPMCVHGRQWRVGCSTTLLHGSRGKESELPSLSVRTLQRPAVFDAAARCMSPESFVRTTRQRSMSEATSRRLVFAAVLTTASSGRSARRSSRSHHSGLSPSRNRRA